MSNFKGTCLNSNIAFKPINIVNKTESGLDISLVTDKNERFERGIIVSIGHAIPKDEKGVSFIKIGDEISVDKHKTTDYTENGVLYKLCYYSDLTLNYIQ